MDKNVLHEFKQTLSLDEDIQQQVLDAFFVNDLYSYLLYARTNEYGVIKDYVLKFMIAQEMEFNTISKVSAVSHVLDCINMYKEYMGNTKIIGYKQPPLEIMLELYEPLMYTMSHNIQLYWKNYEIDDLMQICRLCMCELYRKGYYIHKGILWTTFKNKILEEVRPIKNRGEVVSLEVLYNTRDGGDEKLSMMDVMSDKEEEERQQDADILEANLEIFAEIKNIIIDLVGHRQFDMLYRDYSKGHTTTQSRKLLIKIKNHLKTLGITQSQFNAKYHKKGR